MTITTPVKSALVDPAPTATTPPETTPTAATPPQTTTRPAPWRPAFLLAFAALGCGVLLGGLSVWFLGSVAIAGLSAAALTFDFHSPGALVRLFAVGRTAAKYGERTVGHRAALSDQCRRRADVFRAMAAGPALRTDGWQLGRPDRLSDYLDDVEDIDYGRLRVELPGVSTAFGALGAAAATAVVAPLALPVLALLLLALCAGAARLDRAAGALWLDVHAARRAAAGRLGATMAAVVQLKAEGDFRGEIDAAFESLSQTQARLLVIRRRQAGFETLCGLAGPVMAMAVCAATFTGGATGPALLVPAALAFAWLALGEGLQGGARMVLAALRRRQALRRIAPEADAPTPDVRAPDVPAPSASAPSALAPSALAEDGPEIASRLCVAHLHRRAPDGRILGAPMALALAAGRPTVLTGPSGSGKTSLLKQIGGWIGDDVFLWQGRALSARGRCDQAFLCLHDAAILSDTVRANLFAPDADDEAAWAALRAVELDARFGSCGLEGWITQESLSLGEAQRLNLARAFLSDRPLILLDEPTEHLDDDQAQRILSRLLGQLSDRIVVLSSHRAVASAGVATIAL